MKLPGTVATAWPAVAGLGALALAGLLVLVVAPRWRVEAEARLASLALATGSRAPVAAQVRAAAAPEDPFAAWPDAVASPRRAVALSALARRQGLELLQVREQLDAASHLQLGMNGRATYPALRQFVELALTQDSALALDRLRLNRGEADAAQVEFELQWTLLHRAASGRAAGVAKAGPRP